MSIRWELCENCDTTYTQGNSHVCGQARQLVTEADVQAVLDKLAAMDGGPASIEGLYEEITPREFCKGCGINVYPMTNVSYCSDCKAVAHVIG